MSNSLTSSDFLQGSEYVDYATSPDNFFSILDALDSELMNPIADVIASPKEGGASVEVESTRAPRLVSQKSTSSLISNDTDPKVPAEAGNDLSSPKSNKRKLSNPTEEEGQQQKISHITVERNRRKQINDNLTVLRSLMPSFYVKRGDQASIVGGVADYISELQQVLRSLEAKKQRKAYSDVVMSPRLISSPRTKATTISSLPISPRKPPLSPRLISSLPASPRTPQSIISNNNCSIINNHLHRLLVQQLHPSANNFLSSPTTTMASSSASLLLEPSPSSSNCSTSSVIDNDQLVANSKSRVADVEVKFSGPNVILSTVSPRIPGQALKIISALEHLSLEILGVTLNTDQNTMIYSFTIKIGIECKLSAEELAHQIQQTFY